MKSVVILRASLGVIATTVCLNATEVRIPSPGVSWIDRSTMNPRITHQSSIDRSLKEFWNLPEKTNQFLEIYTLNGLEEEKKEFTITTNGGDM